MSDGRKLQWRAWMLAAVVAAAGSAAMGQEEDQTVKSAEFLLRSSMTIHRNGDHNRLLRSLRHLGDPTLAPLFSQLADSQHPALKIHGILGLAECDPNHKLDLVRLASVKDTRVQAEIVSAAMDSGLLDNDQARQLAQWKDLDSGVKVMVAAQLVRDKQLQDRSILIDALESDNLGRRSMAAMLLLQLGQLDASPRLDALDRSNDPERDEVRAMLLRTSMRFQFDHVATWASHVGHELGIASKLGRLGLETAIRFDAPGATDLWKQHFDNSAGDPVLRMRLALMALNVSPWVKPQFFTPLMNSDDALIRQIGAAGAAVAAKDQISDAVVGLIQMHHPLANTWALKYARDEADEKDAIEILLGLILAYEHDHELRNRVQRLDEAVSATQVLVERSEKMAVALLRPKLASPRTDPLLVQGILLGLIRSTAKHPHLVVQGLGPMKNPNADRMVVFLIARHTHKLDAQQIDDLALMVRGGGGTPDTLRIQAAWTYLKITMQAQTTLSRVLQG